MHPEVVRIWKIDGRITDDTAVDGVRLVTDMGVSDQGRGYALDPDPDDHDDSPPPTTT